MKVKFWGTRGSITKAGPGTLKYGGNTSCVQVISDKGTMLVLDCGTGAHGLGMSIAKEGKAVSGHILITHTHWDHIQGVPFFTPLFIPGNSFHIYGPKGMGESMRETLQGQMQYTYFPISMEAFNANVEFHDLVEGTFQIDDVKVTAHYMNHPALTIGYRIEADGASVVYCTDHEPHDRALAAGGTPEQGSSDEAHCRFMHGADLLIHDCQYRSEEYAAKVGWGHSTMEYVVDMALHARVHKLALFHHDPMRTDEGVDLLVADANKRVTTKVAAATDVDDAFPVATTVFGAAEQEEIKVEAHGGAEITLGSDLMGPEMARSREAWDIEVLSKAQRPQFSGSNADVHHTVLVYVTDPPVVKLLEEAFKGESYVTAHWAQSVKEYKGMLQTHRPSLVVLGKSPGGVADAGLKLFPETRVAVDGVDIIVVCEDGQRSTGHLEVTQWLQAPFSPFYARTRVRSLLLRVSSKWVAATRHMQEEQRLDTLRSLQVLDTEAEPKYDLITALASKLFHTNIALVSLVDNERQWFKSAAGLDARETHRDMAFCAHAILQEDVFQIPDATIDNRFAENPLVTSGPRVRFYAGVPLKMDNGHNVGTLCVIDARPKTLKPNEVELLKQLGQTVSAFLQASNEADDVLAAPFVAGLASPVAAAAAKPAGGVPKSTACSIQ
eukprot:jgi/Mesvir1/28504/Mv06274-RA.1